MKSNMKSNYKENQRKHQTDLLNSDFFYGAKGGGHYTIKKGEIKEGEFIIESGAEKKNLFNGNQEAEEVINYFKDENISCWGGKNITGHILSSQVACLNHLFFIRKDKNTVLKVLNHISDNGFTEVLPVACDKNPAFISFEVVSYRDHLNECKKTPTRGTRCTSIDALIIGKRKDEICLIPIEWKYTELYGNTDESTGESGKKRLDRYSELIKDSTQLIDLSVSNSFRKTIYFIKPFYQLMRQTLWAEQVIAHKDTECLKAVDFLHIHIVPGDNKKLLDKKYPPDKHGMKETWLSCLKNPAKYILSDPLKIVEAIKEIGKYDDLVAYLDKRYNG